MVAASSEGSAHPRTTRHGHQYTGRSEAYVYLNCLLRRPAIGGAFDLFGKDECRRKQVICKQRVGLEKRRGRRGVPVSRNADTRTLPS